VAGVVNTVVMHLRGGGGGVYQMRISRVGEEQSAFRGICSMALVDMNRHTHFEPAYNDIGLYDTSSKASDILCYQLIPYC
jgi:hypothetical protein